MITKQWLARSTFGIGIVFAASANAVPIVISNAGYWLETVGPNTIGLPGAPGGVVTTLFVANTSPTAAGGTTASANFNGTPTSAPGLADPSLWARRVTSPNAFQLQALTVDFHNGGDFSSFTGRDLSSIVPMPLVQNLSVDASADPFGPAVSWTNPTVPGVDIDLIQVVFYSNVSNLEVASRAVLPASATNIDLIGPIPAGFDLTINVRYVDLADDNAAFTSGNILSESRAYINYLAPVPEPSTAILLILGMAGISGLVVGKKRASNSDA